jgi:hypothetical protein
MSKKSPRMTGKSMVVAKAPRTEDLRLTLARLRCYLTAGVPEEDIAEHLEVTWERFLELKKKLFEDESARLRERTPDDVYTEYVLAQEGNLRDLTEVLDLFRNDHEKGTASAAVAAIKLKSEIHDKMIAKGQELGLIIKKPVQHAIAGVVLHQLPQRQLKAAIVKELAGLQGLMSRYGSVDNSILQIDPGPIHYEAAAEVTVNEEGEIEATAPKPKPKMMEAKRLKTSGGQRNKVHGGRSAKRYKTSEV